MNRPPASRKSQAGVTLVELMVALVIGMLLTGAVFGVLASFEGRRRTLTAGNDAEQAGQLAMFKIDRWVRNAGAGLADAWDMAYGCPLHAKGRTGQLLPLEHAIGPPFDAVNPGKAGLFRLAPVLILPGQTKTAGGGKSDVLVLMSGSPSSGAASKFVGSLVNNNELNLTSTAGFNRDDLVLLIDQDNAGVHRPCMLSQVKHDFDGKGTRLPLGGYYYSGEIGNASIGGFTSEAAALRLGTDSGSGLPQLTLVGVGSDSALYSYDLLQASGSAPQAQADGVLEMRALYGVDTDGDDKVNEWHAPTGDYAVSELTAGTEVAADRLRTIKAVRVALVMRSALPEKDIVTKEAPQLFPDVEGLDVKPELGEDGQHFRYRVVDQAVPVRNNLLTRIKAGS